MARVVLHPLFNATELEKSLALFNDLAKRAKNGTISDAAFADAITTKILPPYAEVRSRLEAVAKRPSPNQNVVVRLVDYMSQREKAWNLYAKALREGDADKMGRAHEHMRAAEATAKQMSAR